MIEYDIHYNVYNFDFLAKIQYYIHRTIEIDFYHANYCIKDILKSMLKHMIFIVTVTHRLENLWHSCNYITISWIT